VLVTLAAPILIAAFFGAVLGGAPSKPPGVPVAVVDQDGSGVSHALVAALAADTSLKVETPDEDAARDRVQKGKVRVAIVIPKGFGTGSTRALFRPDIDKPEVRLLVDPSQAITIGMVKGVVAQHAMQEIARADESARGSSDGVFKGGFTMPFTFEQSDVTSGSRPYNAYAHSFAGMGVQFVLFMGIELGVGVLLMRRMGIWKRLRAAPVSRGLLLGSRIASGTLIASILVACIYAAGIAFFRVRIDGSAVGFVAIAIAFALMTSTFGLLIAALGRTPEATRGLAILATLLLVMLGGAWVPTFVFPQWLQQATLWVPTRWAVDGLEAMTWRGLGLDAAVAPVAVMLGYTVLFAAIAVKRFQWEE
jgi:ABC-2 type transport system permease protein